jgi:hypothetical protein
MSLRLIPLSNWWGTTDQYLRDYHPLTIIVCTILAIWMVSLIRRLCQLSFAEILGVVLRVLRRAPLIRATVAQEQEKITSKLQTMLLKYDQRPESPPRFFCLPERGLDEKTLFHYLQTLREFDQESLRHGTLFSIRKVSMRSS